MDFENMDYQVFKMFDEDWGLLTAGSIDDYNTMTIGWGSMGTLWSMNGKNRPVVNVYVKPIRHTCNYVLENDYFTVSFFPREYRKDLGILGTKSGKDCDKVALTKLTPVELEHGVTFKEASLTFVCKKLYGQSFDVDKIPEEIVERYYKEEEPHYMFVGEVVESLG